MRVTNNMLTNNLIYNLNENLKRMELLQYQQATGKKFRVPSDDPIGASKSLKYNTDISKINQYYKNAKDAYSWMNETETALMGINKVLKRMKDISIEAANDTYSDDDLIKIREEVREMKNHLIQISNSTYAGRHVFSGHKTDQKLLNDDGTYNVELIMNDDIDNDKKREIFEYNIGVSEKVKVNTLGGSVFGIAVHDEDGKLQIPDFEGDVEEGDKAYLIDVFDKFEAALGNNDSEEFQNTIERIEVCMEQTLAVEAKIGAKMNRLELTQKKLEDQNLNIDELLSYNENVDLTKIAIELKMAESVYRASLATGARIIQPSLVDFLR